MTVMGSLLVILALAIALNYFLVDQQVPDLMVEWLKTKNLSKNEFLLVVNGLLLVVGCFMDIMSAILIIAPMLAPMADAVGIDPIHMGIIFIVNLEIGYLTPPVGLNLFVSSSLFKKGLGFVVKAVLPTLGIMLASLAIVTWWPGLSLALVHALKEKPAIEAPAPAVPTRPGVPEVAAPSQPAGPAAGEGKVKSLEELMKAARQKQAAEAGSAPGAAQPPAAEGTPAGEPPRVKSMQELMREAKERKEREADAAP
jgi:C4-dicarboxylate transporter DctM subunit